MNIDDEDLEEAPDEDPNWEALAREGEAEAKKRETGAKIGACLRKISKQEKFELRLNRLRPGTRIVVTTFSEADDSVEFTLLDPESGKVRVKDGINFKEPTEGTLLGCEHYTAGKRLLTESKLKMFWWLTYEVRGKTFGTDLNTIKQIQVFTPGSDDPMFTYWSDL